MPSADTPLKQAAPRPEGDAWCLLQTALEPGRKEVDGSLFALANGALGVRGDLEDDDIAPGCFHAGVYDTHPIHYHERFPGFARSTDTRVPVADGRPIRLWVDGALLRYRECTITTFERTLDLHAGVLRRTTRLVTPSGCGLAITSERVVAPGHDVLAVRYAVTPDRDCVLEVDAMIETRAHAVAQGDDPRIGAAHGAGLELLDVDSDEQALWVLQQARGSGISVACAQTHAAVSGWAPARVEPTVHGTGSVTRRFASKATAGQRHVLEVFTGYAVGSADAASRPRAACALAAVARAEGFEALHDDRQRETRAFWEHAGIEVDDAGSTANALRFNLFHVWQSANRDPRHGTAAKGLSGEGYEGHCFWDTEAFALPAMVFTAPQVARDMLRYRHAHLDAARAHARELNHATGALFPWRTIAGGECSAHYPTGSAAYHINADIAYAIGLYLDATGDAGFLLEGGAELLFETARIWPQTGQFDASRGGAFCIYGVTGPDEYTVLVDNNFYTNRMAQQHLRRAVAAWNALSASHPDALAALASRLQLVAEEVARWRRIADAMYLAVDPELGVYAQDDGFLRKPAWPHGPLHTGARPLLLDYHPLQIYRHRVSKQADVVMALALAGHGLDAGTKRNSFGFYEQVTTHDSTLSHAIHGIVASELGLADKAIAYFDSALRVDLDNLHGNTSHGIHMAAMAGSWLGLAWGFGGLRVVEGALSLAPTLPRQWSRYAFGLQWQGRALRVEMDRGGACVQLLSGAPLQILLDGRIVELVQGEPSRSHFPRPYEALVFDLDGVIADTARLHYRAWKRLADEIGAAFCEADNHRLKGVDRAASLEIVLEGTSRRYSAEEKQALAARKNGYYLELAAALGPGDLLPGAERVLLEARAAGLRTALASASRNARTLLERLQVGHLFDTIVDAAGIANPKPAPDIFLAAAAQLGVAPEDCIGIEDAAAGIASIRAAGMASIGIGDPQELRGADAVLPALDAFVLDRFVSTT